MYPAIYLCILAPFLVSCRSDRPPQFLPHGDMSHFSINENTPVGSLIYTLQAVNQEGGKVFYNITSDIFTVNSSTGAVKLSRSLDREIQSVIKISIGASNDLEPLQYIWLERDVIVLDDNDNEPVFLDQPYIFTIPEDTSIGTEIASGIIVADADAGVNSAMSLSCVSNLKPISCKTFSVSTRMISEGKYEGKISLAQNLDFEEFPVLIIPLKAEDHGLVKKESEVAHVIIRVTDVQDTPPQFIGSPYFASLPEETPPDVSVINIAVRDGDVGNPRSLNVSISEPGKQYFKISDINLSDSGIYTVFISTSHNRMDREDPSILKSDGIYEFKILAVENVNDTETRGVSKEAKITILLTDVNDNVPKFSQSEIQISVPEDTPPGSLLTGFDLVIDDDDLEKNAEFTITLQSISESGEMFDVGIENGVSIWLKENSVLDFEDVDARTIVFKIVALDSLGRSSSATVTVNVTDANDNDPQFNQTEYVVRVRENAVPGMEVTSLTAFDKDEGINGRVTYTLQGFGAEMFEVDPSSGAITVARCGEETCLDREIADRYALIYCGRDGGNRLGKTTVIFEVVDVNDNPPVFQSREILGTLHSALSEIQPQIIFHAKDSDSALNDNDVISYSIVDVDDAGFKDVFEIDSKTGVVRAIRSPVGHFASGLPGTVSLRVRGTDGGDPPLSADAYAVITVDNALHKPLVFSHSSYNTTVLETEQPGAVVLQIAALELTTDNEITYAILEGAYDNFEINTTSGVLSVAHSADLDLEYSPAFYKIKVKATSKNVGASALAFVFVAVEDVNNKPPSFGKDYYTAFVHENAEIGTTIVRFAATDPDANNLLKYTIAKPFIIRDSSGVIVKNADDGTHVQPIFKLHEDSGILRVARRLDHSRAANFLISVQVTDVNAADDTINQTSFAQVSLYIQAERTPEPAFSSPWTPSSPTIIYSIPEEPPLHSALFTVTAKSPMARAVKFYKVNNSDPLDYVAIDEMTGIVTLQRRLDYEEMSENKQVEFRIKAVSELNSVTYSSTATVIIDVQNINDNSPMFTHKTYHATVPESSTYPRAVLTVEANDKDMGADFKTIQYSISGDGVDKFDIDPILGVISIKKNAALDRETKSRYILRVIAKDNPDGVGNSQEASAVVIVDVLDENDNYPTFLQVLYQAVIPETIPVGFHVKLVSAADADRGLGVRLSYSISPTSELLGFFSIDEITGEVRVRKPLSGKGRLEPYRIVLEATDFVRTTSVPMLVFITDVPGNDAVPIFEKPEHGELTYVFENAAIGTSVYEVVAKNSNEGTSDANPVRYSLLHDGPASEFQPFLIHRVSGIITTTAKLDREERQNYTIVVIASNSGQPPQHTYRDVTIVVKDEDDNAPYFDRVENSMPIRMNVEEECKPGTVVGVINVRDDDEGINAMAHYVIVDGNADGVFEMKRGENGYGELVVRGRLDFEKKKEYLLTVKVESSSVVQSVGPTAEYLIYSSHDKSMMQVRVVIQDKDDHHPVFLNGNATTGIRSNATKGTEVYKFVAKDEDSITDHIVFKLLSVKFYRAYTNEAVDARSVFALNEQTGVLKTRISLIEFDQGYYIVHVEALSGKFSAETTLNVHVLQERDLLKFVFNKALYEVQPQLSEFQTKLQKMIPSPLPWKINIYDSHFFYQDEDGNSSSVCFQFVNSDNTAFSQSETETLLDLPSQPKLGLLYHNYGVHSVQNCYEGGESYAMSWTEHFVLVIASFMGVLTIMSSVLLHHIFTSYKRNVRRINKQYRMVHPPLSRNGHNNHTTMERQQRIHAWQLQHPSMANATMETSYA